MITIGTIIKSALRKIGVIASGEPLEPDEGEDALESFRQMLDSWSTQSLLIPVVGVVTIPLIQGQAEYTIGKLAVNACDKPAANHSETARPLKYISSFIRDTYETDYQVTTKYAKQYSQISRKSNESRPSMIYIREGWPADTILFNSQPYAAEVLHLEVLQPLAELVGDYSLETVVNLPEGYERALVYSLAMELAPEFEKDPSRLIIGTALESMKWLKRNNHKPKILGVDRAIVNRERTTGTFIINQGP